MRRSGNKALKISIVIIVVLILLVGIIVGLMMLSKNKSMNYYEINLTKSSGQISLSSKAMALEPNADIISKPITVNIDNDSANAHIRAKIIFESNSEDNRVLSFVNQLNYRINLTQTYEGEDYSWKYYKEDNSFYLVTNDTTLRTVLNKDNNYVFLETFKVPYDIEQILSLNSDGDNVQVGEEIVFKVVFEAIQSELMLGEIPTIQNCREIFNNFSTYSENGFTSVNGYITSCDLTSENIILPKYVGEDYIIGIKENVFTNANTQKIIVPGNYIYFSDNTFSGATNLNFVALKSYTKINLTNTTFAVNSNLNICVPKDNLMYLKTTYSLAPYVSSIKTYTEVTNPKISELDTNIVFLYAPNITEFEGTFQNFTKLKSIYAPSLTKINENMFFNNITLIDADLPNVTLIEKNAFNGCTNLINTSFSKKLLSIGENSFFGCNKLTNANFIENLELIPKQAFRNCTSLTSLKFKNENLQILNSAFYHCTNLRNININKLNILEDYAFAECSGLRYVNIKSSEAIISNNAFNNSNFLFVFNDETFKSNFIAINENFANKTMLLKVVDGVLTKYEGTVKKLDLTDFNMYEKITEIGDNVFKNNTSIQTLTIPSSVRKIGSKFIDGAINIYEITINSFSVPEINELSFNNCKEGLTIYVPSVNIDVYNATFDNQNITILGK